MKDFPEWNTDAPPKTGIYIINISYIADGEMVNKVDVGYFAKGSQMWLDLTDFATFDSPVTAWMNLPEPYKES